jgi:4-hydroxy-4-methyl-2-oxoglutarate aldolase
MSQSLLNKLLELDSCAVSDALDQLKSKGVAIGLRNVTNSKRIVGRAVTVQLGLADGTPSKRHLCTEAVDASGEGDVIVIAHENRMEVAGWGGILSQGAVKNSIEGVVIDGACRDIDESRELNLPIYAKAAIPITARGRIMEKSWNEPVTICGIQVEPGDYVLADASGTVFIPQTIADQVIHLAEKIVSKERMMAANVQKGYKLAEVMGASYEELLVNAEGSHD